MWRSRLIYILALSLFTAPLFAQDPFPDLTGDDYVDFEDFAVLAANWLEHKPIPQTMPIYHITSPGATREQADSLASALNMPSDSFIVENGTINFVDAQNFQYIPAAELADPDLRTKLLEGTKDLDNPEQIAFQCFDFEKLKDIKPIPDEQALATISNALEQSKLAPYNGQASISHTTLEIVEQDGTPIIEPVSLDTVVGYQFKYDGVEVQGPGAILNASVDPEGRVTQLYCSNRPVARGKSVPLLAPEKAITEFAQGIPAELSDLAHSINPAGLEVEYNLRANLIYYAPPLDFTEASTIIPAYSIGGTVTAGETVVEMLERTIPATADPNLVPQVTLKAVTSDINILAEAVVTGGKPPYVFSWSSSNVSLTYQDTAQITYAIDTRQLIETEIVSVTVVDLNGISVSKRMWIPVSIKPQTSPPAVHTAAASVNYGIERAVSDLGAANQRNFARRFDDGGVVQQFNWTGLNAWELDFKDGSLDYTYVDNVDILFYIGHGAPNAFTFEGRRNDQAIFYDETPLAWGDKDLEFLSLLSCQVLKDEWEGKSSTDRWGRNFAGLHLMTGFHTNACDWGGFGKRYAEYLLGRTYWYSSDVTILPVRSAWCKAKAEKQPWGREVAIIGPIGPEGLANFNDYFWGKGPVGPDITPENIQGFWRISF